ncbi:MAG TPA: cupin domain-containing protein [Gaiellales bacterium]|nr:cupin domain-containing protein [Gaiellales bacterium]
MSERYTLRNLGEVDDAAPKFGLGESWEARMAQTALRAEQTGVGFFRLKAGRRSPFAHRHDEAEEVYVILRGRGRMRLDDEVVEVGPLDAVRVAPSVVRAFEAGADGLDFLAVGPHHPQDGELVEDSWAGGG